MRAPGWKVQRVLWLNCTRTSPRSVMRCTVPVCPINCGGSWRQWPGRAGGWGARGHGEAGHGNSPGGASHLGHPGVPPAVAFLHLPQQIRVQQTFDLVPTLEGLAISTDPALQLCGLAWGWGVQKICTWWLTKQVYCCQSDFCCSLCLEFSTPLLSFDNCVLTTRVKKTFHSPL